MNFNLITGEHKKELMFGNLPHLLLLLLLPLITAQLPPLLGLHLQAVPVPRSHQASWLPKTTAFGIGRPATYAGRSATGESCTGYVLKLQFTQLLLPRLAGHAHRKY